MISVWYEGEVTEEQKNACKGSLLSASMRTYISLWIPSPRGQGMVQNGGYMDAMFQVVVHEESGQVCHIVILYSYKIKSG